jgi:type IV secretory pathway VirD2 relaxase
MTKNGLDIQTISTKRTDFQTDRVLLLEQVTEKEEKALPSHFLKFLLINGTFDKHRNKFGGLRLLPMDKNRSLNDLTFDKKALLERQDLYEELAKKIWNVNRLNEQLN